MPPFNLLPDVVRGREDLIDEITFAVRGKGGRKGRRNGRQSGARPIWLLHGLGGIGKTTIALAVAENARQANIRTFWVNAADSASIQAGMWRVARDIGGAESSMASSPAEPGAVDAIWEILENAAVNWVLIFDNADDLQKLSAVGQRTEAGNGWLRESRRGTVIVTSRTAFDAAWGSRISARQVGPLDSSFGAKMLLDIVGGKTADVGTVEEAEQLAERLGGLPLALRAAGRYLATSVDDPAQRTFTAYQSALDVRFRETIDAGTRRLFLTEADQLDPRELVMATWGLSLDFLAERGFPEARTLVYLISRLGPSPVSRDLINTVVQLDDKLLKKAGRRGANAAGVDGYHLPATLERLSELFTALRMLALVDEGESFDPHGHTGAGAVVVMHPLVAEVFTRTLADDQKKARFVNTVAIATITRLMESVAGEPRSIAAWRLRPIEPQVSAAAQAVVANQDGYHRRIARKFARVVGLGVEQLTRFISPGMVLSSLSTYRDLSVATVGLRAKSTKWVRHRIGHQLWNLGRYEEAVIEFRASASSISRVLWVLSRETTLSTQIAACGLARPNKPDEGILDAQSLAPTLAMFSMLTRKPLPAGIRLKAHRSLAVAYFERRRFVEAEAEHRAVFDAQRRVLGEEHPDTLTNRSDIAVAMHEQRRFAEAEVEHRAVLEARLRVLGEEHPHSLRSRSAVAVALHEQGRFVEAEAEHRAVLDVQRRVLGEDHPDTLRSRAAVAVGMHEQRRYADAEAEHRAILDVRLRVLGEEHPDTLTNRSEIAVSMHEQRRFAEAEAEHRAVLDVRLRVLGEEHPHTLKNRWEIGVAVHEQGRFVEAETEHRAVLDGRLRVLGEEHPDTLRSRAAVAVALHEQGRFVEAEAEFRAVFDIRRRVLGEEHPDTLTNRSEIAVAMHEQRRFVEAEAEHRAVLDVRLRVLGDEHPHSLRTRSAIAVAMHEQHRLVEAVAEYRAVYDIQRRVLGEQHPDTVRSRNNIRSARQALQSRRS